jgi:hypothetical protein
MKITIEHVKDNPDGSADVVVNFDEDGARFLIERGLLDTLREGMDNMKKENEMSNTIEFQTYIPDPEEDQAWEEAQRQHDIQERNKAAMGAWNAAGMFVTENADKLGRLSLREAYEKGFLDGYKFAKEK